MTRLEAEWEAGPVTPQAGCLRAIEAQACLGRYLSEAGKRGFFKEMAKSIGQGDESWHACTIYALLEGRPFFVSEPICGLVEKAAASLPDNWTMIPEMVPALSGFVYLQTGWRLPGDDEEELLGSLLAMSWAPIYEMSEEYGGGTFLPVTGGRVDMIDMLGVTFYILSDKRFPNTPPLPLTHIRWPMNMSVGEVIAKRRADPEEKPYQRSNDRYAIKVRLVATFLSFIRDKLLVFSNERAARSVRRRVEREAGKLIWDGSVEIVKLRDRAMRQTGDDDRADENVNWSCQWLVNGHWRQQWCPSRGIHEPRWIGPHIKGPADKPLKLHPTRYAVVR